MDKKLKNEKLLEAIRYFIDGKKADWSEPVTEEEWMEFFKLAGEHQVLPMVYDAVYPCLSFKEGMKGMLGPVKGQVIRQVTMQSFKTQEFLSLYKKLNEKNIHPLVVKGIICRNLYSEPDYRTSGDEDLLIPWDQYPLCHQVLLENGMEVVDKGEDIEKAEEVTYHKKGGLLTIELHKRLFASESQAYGKFNEFFSTVFDRQRVEDIQGVPVYTMSHTDHFLYLFMHAFKHFLHSGFGIRQVCDIVMYGNTYGAQIDWDYVLEKCASVRGDLFAASLLDIGEKVLNFDPDKACYPQSWISLNADGDAILEDLMEGGIFGDSSLSRKHSSNITLEAVSSDMGAATKVSLRKTLFPDRSYMEKTYTYLKKYSFLIGLAWAERIIYYLKNMRKMSGNSATKSIQIGTKRVDLMKKYKIIQ